MVAVCPECLLPNSVGVTWHWTNGQEGGDVALAAADLSVLLHELGHLIGYTDGDSRLCIMQYPCYGANAPFFTVY